MYIYDLKSIKLNSLIIYHHIGLGDIVICNGLVNYVSNLVEKVYLVVDEKFKDQAKYLYSDNPSVEILSDKPISVNNLNSFVEKLSIEKKTEVLQIGWDNYSSNFFQVPFYKAFYKQLKLPYSYSYKYFRLPTSSQLEEKLSNHLVESYEIDFNKKIKLIHSEASDGSYELNLRNENSIYVTKQTDLYGNIFLYRDVVKKADEIHCINSSFVHFIDRIDTDADLYYHNVRGSLLKLKKDWNVINYEN